MLNIIDWETEMAHVSDHAQDLSNDTFKSIGKVHDWRNYVPLTVRIVWPSLSTEVRQMIALTAHEGAKSETWD